MAHVLSPPSGPRCCAGVCTAQLCRCWGTSFALLKQSHSAPSCPANAPKCAGREQLLFPASTAPGSWAVAVHRQAHPTPPASALAFLRSGSFCIHTEGVIPLQKRGHPPPSPRCSVPLYCCTHCLLSQCWASSLMWNYWINMMNAPSPAEPCQRL